MSSFFRKVVPALICFGFLSRAGATTISYDLTASGYGQNTPVADNLFESEGLLLSSPTGLISACNGYCISATPGLFTGSIYGQFVEPGTTIGTTASALIFYTGNYNAVFSLYDSSGDLVTTLAGSTILSYNGTTGIEYFAAFMNYDGISSQSFTEAISSPVAEPGTLLLLGTGTAGFLLKRVRLRA